MKDEKVQQVQGLMDYILEYSWCIPAFIFGYLYKLYVDWWDKLAFCAHEDPERKGVFAI